MLTASLTRATTISPVANCDRKLKFLEAIDLAPLPLPKPKEVSIKAVSRRPRVKQMSRRHTADYINRAEESSPDPTVSRRESDSQDGNQGPRSPCPSELSFDSFASSGGRNSHYESGVRSTKTSDSGRAPTNNSCDGAKIINATIEVLKPGGLQGDYIPLRITVNHVKHVKSLHGVIVTMYRQARVDMHPALPLGSMREGGKGKFEDYYPKSMTGLGGLSLSAAGSSQIFRKDLSQTSAPLIVDPTSLTAEVKAAVQVPEAAFPTILCVPGAMISFRYHIEVVLDLQGRFSGQDRFLPNIGLLNQSTNSNPATGGGYGNDGSVLATWDANIMDTEPLRRDKSIVSCVFEIVVGTRDSDRRRGKHKAEATHQVEASEQAQFQGDDHEFALPGDWQKPYGGDEWAANYYGTEYEHNQRQNIDWTQHDGHRNYGAPDYQYRPHDANVGHMQASRNAEYEMQLPEKERLRRAEERLLPSQPPNPNGQRSTDDPSAPPLLDGPVHWDAESADGAASSQTQTETGVNLGSRNVDALTGGVPTLTEPVPPYSSVVGTPSSALQDRRNLGPGQESHYAQSLATDDKEELQRRRLQMDASSPDDVPSESQENQVADTTMARRVPVEDRPTAPVLEEDDEATMASLEGLPRYQR